MKHVIFTLILTLFVTSCALDNHAKKKSGQPQASRVETKAFVAFKSNVHPILVTNCNKCHGQSQEPKHSVTDAWAALDVILSKGLVDKASPSNSKLVLKAANPAHSTGYGCTTCGDELSAKLLHAIKLWIDVEKKEQAELNNRAPTVADSTFKGNMGTAISGRMNAVDPENKALKFSIVQPPLSGDFQKLNLETGEFEYQAPAGFTGFDRFIFKVSDGALDSANAEVRIQVLSTLNPQTNTAPIVNNMSFTLSGTTLNGTLVGMDAEGDALNYIIGSQPQKGTLSQFLSSAGSFVYTPNAGVSGTDTFTFVANDGLLNSNAATVTIEIPVLPKGPENPQSQTLSFVASADATVNSSNSSTNYGTDVKVEMVSPTKDGLFLFNVTGVSGTVTKAVLKLFVQNDSVMGGDFYLSSSFTEGTVNYGNAPAKSTKVGSLGEVVKDTIVELDVTSFVKDNGVFVLRAISNSTNTVGYNSKEASTGKPTLFVTFGGGTSMGNQPPVAVNSNLITTASSPKDATLSATDPNGDSLTFSISKNSLLGSVTLLDNKKGTYRYTPSNTSGTDSFNFTVTDGVASATGTVSIQVNAAQSTNRTPVALDLNVKALTATDLRSFVFGNDPDGDALTFSVVTSPTQGTLKAFDVMNGEFIYTSKAGYVGSDSFTYKVSDGKTTSSTARVIMTVESTISQPTLCDNDAPAPVRIWRLTHTQYNNSVRDVLGVTSNPGSKFTETPSSTGFKNGAIDAFVPVDLASDYQTASEVLSASVLSQAKSFAPSCASTFDANSEICVTSLIATLGKKLFRQPISSSQQTMYLELYRTVKTGANANDGVKAIFEAMLQSPSFLYRTELGSGAGPKVQLTSYEMAAQLSYALLNTTPDAALIAAADANKLATPADVQTQVDRLLADPKAKDGVWEFVSEYFDINLIDTAVKDPAYFPSFSDSVKADMRSEVRSFVDYAVWNSTGTLNEILTANYTFLNANLASFYGISGVTGSSFQRVTLDAAKHSGILTQGAFLTVKGTAKASNPIRRGIFIREEMLCQDLPPPVVVALDPVPPPEPGITTRERYFQHSSNNTCYTCHRYIDPLGFGFENFDGVGRYRTTESGKTVDSSGFVERALVIEGTYTGATELSQKLSQSPEVSDCFANKFYTFSFGRQETNQNSCAIRNALSRFKQTNGSIKDQIKALTSSDAFFYRTK